MTFIENPRGIYRPDHARSRTSPVCKFRYMTTVIGDPEHLRDSSSPVTVRADLALQGEDPAVTSPGSILLTDNCWNMLIKLTLKQDVPAGGDFF